jgi:DNA repair photolyase
MSEFRKNIKGRGASSNPDQRFQALQTHAEPNEADAYEEKIMLRTEFIRDSAKTVVTENKSPDIPFRFSLNPYRGCEHGCAYCYARPTHEYLGFSAGLDFESKIMVKEDAPELLREKLMARSWAGEHIVFSGNTDCYQPVERKLEITRRCLQVMAEFRNPFAIITKNSLVARDIDVIAPMAELSAAIVTVSVTTLDDKLCAVLEPRTARPASRLATIRKLSEAGIPVSVNVAPVIPGLTDHEMPAILHEAYAAGARYAGMTVVRLPLAVAPIFEEWLTVHRPERKEKVLGLIRDVRGGKLNDASFGSRFRGEGAVAKNLHQMFDIYTRKAGFSRSWPPLSSEHFVRPGDQLSLL